MVYSVLNDTNNTNKQLRNYNDDGKFVRLSVDETIANNLNKWQGWSCTAGTNGLYIDFDGNLWICNTASANVDRFNHNKFKEAKENFINTAKARNIIEHRDIKEWNTEYDIMKIKFSKTDESVKKIFKKEDNIPGLLGNIFDGFDLPTARAICKWKSCGCGADVFLAKAKNDAAFENLAVYKDGFNGQYKTNQNLINSIKNTDIVGMEPNFPIPYQILWDLGRNCNYDCSYCWPSVHNRDSSHKSLETLITTADKIITKWSINQPIRWNFGGGEPTINPNFLNFIKYLKERNQFVLVTSNGSRPRKYWKDAIQHINSVNLSVHFEFAEESKLLVNIEEICQHFDDHDDDHWLEIKLMCNPQSINRALVLRDDIKNKTTMLSNGANNRIKGAISLVPIRSLEDGGVLVDYTKEQLELLQTQ